jgi:hypothetical protein
MTITRMRNIGIMTIALLMSTLTLFANKEADSKDVKTLNITVDTYSKHQWRGFFSGETPTFEPSATFGLGKWSVGVWTATTFDNSYQEVDLYAIYSHKNFSLGFFNYFDPSGNFLESNYLEFEKGKTEHLYSIDASYTLPVLAPVKFTLSTLIGGNDVDPQGDFSYSTYFEPSYVHSFGKFSIKGAIGAALNKSMYNGHSENFSIVNTLVKAQYRFTIKEKYHFPVHATTVYNPFADKFVFTAGVSFSTDFKF